MTTQGHCLDDTVDQSTDATHRAPAADTPGAAPVQGLIRGLAASLGLNGTMLLAITKLSESELLVSIQPTPGENEDASTAIPLQVSGSPEEIDVHLVAALADYVPARRLVADTAREVAEKTASAAAAAKAEADRRRSTASKSQTTGATPPKSKLESLTITVTPGDAEIALTNSLNKLIPMTSGVAKDLPAGRYELRVSKDDYKPYTHTLTVFKADALEVVLEQAELSLLGL